MVNEANNLGDAVVDRETATALKSVVINLSAEQQEAVASLYEAHTVESNGGPCFGVFGQAYIDPLDTAGEYGTAQFYWLNQEQYDTVRTVIVKTLYPELESETKSS